MQFVFIDFETYWTKTHSLSKMSPLEYVTHADTEIISCAVKFGDGETKVLFGEDNITKQLARVDWSDKAVVAHNMSGFDSMILAWRFGIKPRMYLCTLAMARPLHAKTVGLSLGKLVAHYGIGVKDNSALINTQGKRLRDFTKQELLAMREYNKNDTDQCAMLFEKLRPHYNAKELWQMDATIRMLVEPKFELDKALLEVALSAERDQKLKTLMELDKMLRTPQERMTEALEGFTQAEVEERVRSMLASAPKFSALLQERGVEVPMKPSPTNPDKMTPALAKTDEAFLALQEHEDPVVAAAARARLSVKSTLLETRIEAFLSASSACGGKLPIPLHLYGADTTGRWSGWLFNPQNLPRVGGTPKNSDALRNSIKAPRGYKVIVSDLSGIELRVNHFLWQVPSSMRLYQESPDKADLYKDFASRLYDVDVGEVTKEQRQIGKVCLAEGTQVLTDSGPKPIESVSVLDLLWDGVEWVTHDGPVYNGEKVTITYDGIEATPDHEVWVEDGRKVCLRDAASQSLRLARSGDGGTPLGFGGAGVDGNRSEIGVYLRTGSLHGVLDNETSLLQQSQARENPRVSVMQAEVRSPSMVASAPRVCATAMHQSERPELPELWREGGDVRVPHGSEGRCVGDGEHWCAEGVRAGPCGQRQGVRTWEPSLGNEETEYRQQEKLTLCEVPRVQAEAPGGDVLRQHTTKPALEGAHVPRDCGTVQPPVVQTKRRVWDILNAGPRHRFTANGRLVSNCHLGLGFGAGPNTFQKVAKLMGNVEIDTAEAQHITYRWREEYAPIVQGWKTCHASLPAILTGGRQEIDPWGLCTTEQGAIVLPSGRRIRYPELRKESLNGKTEWWYGTGRHRARIYAGKIDENCIAEGTLVLTDRGWIPIEDISLFDLVHDGEEFVRHEGIINKSVQTCIQLDGVWMTPDHEVLTNDGWKEASQVQRPYRPAIWGVARDASGRIHGEIMEMEVPVQVRNAVRETRSGCDQRSEARRNPKLRVHVENFGVQSKFDSRYEQASGVCGVQEHAESMHATDASSLGELWGSRSYSVRAVDGIVREFLEGHGRVVPTRVGVGPQGQQPRVLPGELPLGGQEDQCNEQTQFGARRGRAPIKHGDRDSSEHSVQPPTRRLVTGGTHPTAVSDKQVYDVVNCGPRKRFVVLGDEGPFIVHNCVQALARDVVADCALAFYKLTKLYPSLTVHDELVYVVPEGEAEDLLAVLQKVMRTPPQWWSDLIVWSEGDIAQSYGAAK